MATGAGMTGNILGNVAMLAPTAMVGGIPAAAGIGAATGLAQPSTSTGETIQNTLIGGIAAPAGIVAGRGLAAGYQGIKALVEPFTAPGRNRIAGRVLQDFSANPAAVQAATSAKTATGALPMLSEAARDPGIATLERSLAQQDPRIAAQLAQRGMENNAARVGVVEQLAGDDASRMAAQAAREAASTDAYHAATNANYTVDDKLSDLLKRPAVRQAMERAKTMAENQGRPFSFNVESRTGLGGLGNQQAITSKQITGQGLQDLKEAMDAMLTDPTSGFMGKSGEVVKNLRGQIV